MKIQYIILRNILLALTVSLLWTLSALAKGNFDKVTIQDLKSGWKVDSTDPILLTYFGLGDFQSGPVSEAQAVGEGYELTRYAISRVDGKTYVPVDRLRYYLGKDGSDGYVYYEGWPGVYTEFDRKWYAATPQGAAAIQHALNSRRSVSQWIWLVTAVFGLTALGIAWKITRLHQRANAQKVRTSSSKPSAG
mgnify:CR=1 FL=1